MYRYIGRAEDREDAARQPGGVAIRSLDDLVRWVAANPDAAEEGATYVVDLGGVLRLAPRRSEHVACARGQEVLAAGELRATPAGKVLEISNHSAGYCPGPECWPAVASALASAGVAGPPFFTRVHIFRRCRRCDQMNLVKDGWFVCVFCDAELPRTE